MKKIVSIILVLATALSMGTMAFADGTTTLTTTVPDAAYTLNIPANQTVEFNTTKHSLTVPTVTDASGFAVGKNILVTMTTTEFASENVNTTIPFKLMAKLSSIPDALELSYICFKGESSGQVSEAKSDRSDDTWFTVSEMFLSFAVSDWGKALGGDYTATITFTSEVVAAE